MIFKIYQSTAFLITFILLSSSLSIHSVGAQTNSSSTGNTFSDPKTGISFQYPLDWHIASKEYVNAIYSSGSQEYADNLVQNSNTTRVNSSTSTDVQSIVKPVVILLPESLSGTTFFILSEILPFQIPVEKYFEITKKNILLEPTAQVGKPIPISISDVKALKFNVTHTDDPNYPQTDILFVKDSKGYDIISQLGPNEKLKESKDLEYMANSLKIDNTK